MSQTLSVVILALGTRQLREMEVAVVGAVVVAGIFVGLILRVPTRPGLLLAVAIVEHVCTDVLLNG